MRAVTGHNFTGRRPVFCLAPEEYGAIYFHDDDLEDAGWEADFALTVPDDLRSGVYAVHLQAGDAEDYVPFFVRPQARDDHRAHRGAAADLHLPRLRQRADHLAQSRLSGAARSAAALQPQDHYIVAHGLKSAYDHHADGTGVCFSSRLRPVLNCGPKYSTALILAPQHFNADLYLIDWLEAMGHPYDVLTDEDLHAEGVGSPRARIAWS